MQEHTHSQLISGGTGTQILVTATSTASQGSSNFYLNGQVYNGRSSGVTRGKCKGVKYIIKVL